MEDSEVIHSKEAFRFEILVGTHCALLEYQITENNMTIHHTFVPPELRGRGLAAQLAEAALNYAKQAELTVIPQCSYIAAYMERK